MNGNAGFIFVSLVISCAVAGCSNAPRCYPDPGDAGIDASLKPFDVKCDNKDTSCWGLSASNLERLSKQCIDKITWDDDNDVDTASDLAKVSIERCTQVISNFENTDSNYKYLFKEDDCSRLIDTSNCPSDSSQTTWEEFKQRQDRIDKIEKDDQDNMFKYALDYAVDLHRAKRCSWHIMNWWW